MVLLRKRELKMKTKQEPRKKKRESICPRRLISFSTDKESLWKKLKRTRYLRESLGSASYQRLTKICLLMKRWILESLDTWLILQREIPGDR